MSDLRQAAQQALETLETLMLERGSIYETAITALREALAQPAQEPVAWNVIDPTGNILATEKNAIRGWARVNGYKPTVEGLLGLHELGWRVLPTSPPAAQPEQEPVAFYHPHKGFYWAKPTHIAAPTVVDVPPVPLYVKWKAAQRPWVGLTDEDLDYLCHLAYTGDEEFALAVQARLQERNT